MDGDGLRLSIVDKPASPQMVYWISVQTFYFDHDRAIASFGCARIDCACLMSYYNNEDQRNRLW